MKEIYSGNNYRFYHPDNFEGFMDSLGAEKILCYEDALRFRKVWFFTNVAVYYFNDGFVKNSTFIRLYGDPEVTNKVEKIILDEAKKREALARDELKEYYKSVGFDLNSDNIDRILNEP